ncbi:MAG TPA: Re/Si-specific NAD(P)(+) transhydrogenase subunit alpha [Bryobacteraceae bacterium]|jgi:NAD(P) transhydrogenase subunit alpha|nr:Re/Si-specific NAD(P)(+) transhydrogenase subunit alpha [Bryobacteraceae bacterium]
MPLKIGFITESAPGEQRVAMSPIALAVFQKTGAEFLMEAGAGARAGFPDAEYTAKGVRLAARDEVFAAADVLLQVRTPGANPEAGGADLVRLRLNQTVIGFGEPLTALDAARDLAERGVTFLAMELMPRITRAQSMDALSSMATIAGYKAVLIAADALPRMFPMLMTAAGTIAPAKVLVIGAGVAGLQAIATARRLGALVSGYDIRAAVREQIESLGARFIVLDVPAAAAEDKGGYAKAMDEDFYRRQREAMAAVLAAHNVVITTAAVPGRRAPVLVTREMVERMEPGSVIVDIAAERGGNCELTCPGQVVETGGVRIHGPVNLPSTVPYHASQMYAKNIATFLKYLIKDGALALNLEDEIVRETLVTHAGEVVHPRVRELMGNLVT